MKQCSIRFFYTSPPIKLRGARIFSLLLYPLVEARRNLHPIFSAKFRKLKKHVTPFLDLGPR